MPLTLALLLIAILPESVRYLEVSGADQRKISKILARISPELGKATVSRSQHQDLRRNAPVFSLFTEGRAAGTILLWIPFFMNLLMLYFVVFWLPALLRQTGKPVSAGATAIFLFSVAGIAGSFVEGNLMNRWGAFTVLLAEFLCTTLLIVSLALLECVCAHHGDHLLFWVSRCRGACREASVSLSPPTFYPDLDPLHGNWLVPGGWTASARLWAPCWSA